MVSRALHHTHCDRLCFRFFPCVRNHFGGRFDAMSQATRANALGGFDEQGSCAATDIQNSFSRSKFRQIERALAEFTLTTKGQNPDEPIVKMRRVYHLALLAMFVSMDSTTTGGLVTTPVLVVEELRDKPCHSSNDHPVCNYKQHERQPPVAHMICVEVE